MFHLCEDRFASAVVLHPIPQVDEASCHDDILLTESLWHEKISAWCGSSGTELSQTGDWWWVHPIRFNVSRDARKGRSFLSSDVAIR